MSDVGIRLSMEETVSSVAPKVSEALRSITEAGKELRDSLDLTGLEDEYKQFAERLNKIYDAQQAQKGPGQQMVQQLGGAVPGMLRAGGGVAQRLGQTGDAVGAGADVLGVLGGVVKSMGPLGILVSSLGAVGLGLNALEMQYEKQIPELMDLTAILNKFGKSAQETSAEFKNVMDEVSGKASKFGYSLEYGMNVTKSLAQISGVEGTRAIRGAGKVLEFGRGYGVSPEALSRYMGLGLRFGQGENIFERAGGGLEAAGMGKGLFQEYLSSTLDIFEQGLSRGIVKWFDEIGITQTWLANLGDVFKGQYGLQVYQQMEQSMVGATSLSDEGDVLLWRATKRFLEEEPPEELRGKSLSQLDVLKEMEKGISYGVFKRLREDISGLTMSYDERIRILRESFKKEPTYTVAEMLWNAPEAEEFKGLLSGAGKIMETPEGKLLKAQEETKNYIRRFGGGLLPWKSGAVAGAAGTVGEIANILGVGPESEERKRQAEERRRIEAELDRIPGLMLGPSPGRSSLTRLAPGKQLESSIVEALMNQDRYSREDVGAAEGLAELFKGLSPEQSERLRTGDILYKTLTKTAMAPESEGGRNILVSELRSLYEELLKAVRDLQGAVKEMENIDINIPYKVAPEERH